MTTKKEKIAQINEKIKKVKEQKASVLTKIENLAKQKLPRKVKKAKREPLQKEWQRLWDELKELYAERKRLSTKKESQKSKKRFAGVLKKFSEKYKEYLDKYREVEVNEELMKKEVPNVYAEMRSYVYEGARYPSSYRLQNAVYEIAGGSPPPKKGVVDDDFIDETLRYKAITHNNLKRVYPSGKVLLYRGIQGKQAEKIRKFLEEGKEETIKVESYSLTSWTNIPEIAEHFGNIILEKEFDISDIWGFYIQPTHISKRGFKDLSWEHEHSVSLPESPEFKKNEIIWNPYAIPEY